MFTWDEKTHEAVLTLKNKGHTYKEIADLIGTTTNSVKHKIRRLKQDENQDRYKHTHEKINQITRYVPLDYLKFVLETHAGFGCLTDFYANYAIDVLSLEIKKDRVDEIAKLNREAVTAIQCDSEHELFFLVHRRLKFTFIDIDPYGLPSKYFPHVFSLIDDGFIALTFPVLGVAQINKITIAHYKNFWDIDIKNKDMYLQKICDGLSRYAFMNKRSAEILSIEKFDRIYRFIIKVKKESLLDIVGLKVNRNPDQACLVDTDQHSLF
jgi:hypothetical protein